MASIVINCDGSSSSFQNNGNIRVTYSTDNGSITLTEIAEFANVVHKAGTFQILPSDP